MPLRAALAVVLLASPASALTYPECVALLDEAVKQSTEAPALAEKQAQQAAEVFPLDPPEEAIRDGARALRDSLTAEWTAYVDTLAGACEAIRSGSR